MGNLGISFTLVKKKKKFKRKIFFFFMEKKISQKKLFFFIMKNREQRLPDVIESIASHRTFLTIFQHEQILGGIQNQFFREVFFWWSVSGILIGIFFAILKTISVAMNVS
jgi:hypothetical protein